ncbi:hypothetical protein KUTeg_023189 [Tegillarca granosa]|uniref:YqaJ viral recombinase domain-containing protein n=1 Tax=Tegillarca granosa TaxID=220873 RepID=A0ABQ9E4I2_TEGGR|nr:hypothetical protein KUTeg_023189 [Tegillarca granosa]
MAYYAFNTSKIKQIGFCISAKYSLSNFKSVDVRSENIKTININFNQLQQPLVLIDHFMTGIGAKPMRRHLFPLSQQTAHAQLELLPPVDTSQDFFISLQNTKILGLRALPEDIAKTSQPQTWHTPRGEKIRGKVVQEIEVSSYHNSDNEREIAPKAIKSTLYNPVRGEQVDWKSKYEKLSETSSDMLILPALQNYDVPMVNTKFGKHCKGSTLSYQQPIESDCIINIYDGIAFPELPLENFMNNNYQTVLSLSQTVNFEGLTLSLQEINKFELQTRLQSLTNLWYKIRKHRITASKVGDIYKRRKDFKTLTDRFKSTRNVTTAALRRGLACEPVAVSAYSCKLENKVNLYPCGVVVSFSAPWLAASPDRKVYNPERNPPFGLLEIKCPSTSSVLEVNYLKKDETGSLSIKRSHSYYYQVLSQLAVTGLTWCDLYIWCENDDHLETIHFDNILWQQVKDRLDEFFFSYYL